MTAETYKPSASESQNVIGSVSERADDCATHFRAQSPNALANAAGDATISYAAEAGKAFRPVQLTIVTAIQPARLSKGYSLDASGELKKSPGGRLAEGSVEVRAFAGLCDFAAILQSLTPAQALIYGVPINRSASRIVTKDAFALLNKPEGVTTRTNETFEWPHGPGVMMLDYDPSPECNPRGRDELVADLRTVLPDPPFLWWPSASSCIYQGEKELRGVKGQRLWMLVKDAADIPRAGAVLTDRLWLAGFGSIQISKSGQMLERTLVDAAVWQTSRLDFAGGAACGDGLYQRRGAPVLIPGADGPIDTRIALPDLTPEENELATNIKAVARAEMSPEADFKKEGWIAERVESMVPPEHRDDPVRMKEAEAIARRAVETSVLAGDFVVPVERAGKVELVTVGDILDNRDRWHGCLTRDPLEPDYDGGRLVGRLYLMQARPHLYSFAHGGRSYRLHRAPARIELVKGHTPEAVNETLDLLRRDPIVFDFGGQLALADSGRVHPLCEHRLSYHLGSLTQYWKWVIRGDSPVKADCDPTPQLLKQIISLGERRKLKPLDGVITGPTIRLDGSVLDKPGYDKETRLLFEPVGDWAKEVPEKPTLDDAKNALDTLMYPFEKFPFVDENAKGALLAAILTAVVRPVLPTAPAFAFDAPVQGSGKSLLASCVGALVEGQAPDVWPHTQGRDDEEIRKRLTTALRSGVKTIVWDNVTGTFDSAALAGFMTAGTWSDRILGKSEASSLPNRALLILTGNNLTLAGDMPRRVIICRIDPAIDEPFAREFDLDPLKWVLANRMEMLTAACVLIRARFTHAIPPASGRLGSFEAWDDLVRQTVVWANTQLRLFEFGDPMDLVREAQAADPEVEVLFALLDALRNHFGCAEFRAKDVIAACGGFASEEIKRAIDGLAGQPVTSARSLGKILKYREGRMAQKLRLMGRFDKSKRVRMYRVQADDG